MVFTDGSFKKGVGLWSTVVIDDITSQRDVFWGTVPQRLVDGWQAQAGDQIISQIEAYAALLVRWHFRARWKGRKALFFIDNDAARYALIKSSSGSSSLLLVTDCFHSFDAEFPLIAWIERVASASNIADLPSRDQQEEAAALINGSLLWRHHPRGKCSEPFGAPSNYSSFSPSCQLTFTGETTGQGISAQIHFSPDSQSRQLLKGKRKE